LEIMNLLTKIEKGDERSLILGRPIVFYRSFVPLSKAKVPGALMLSQAWYWHQRRGTSKSIMKGWFYKTDKDWQDETGLTLKQLRSARKALSEVGVLKCQRKGVPAKMHYQLQEQVLFQLLMANSSTQACVSTHACVSSSCAERAQQVLPKGTNSNETTTEITREDSRFAAAPTWWRYGFASKEPDPKGRERSRGFLTPSTCM
jgi:hypothetical protein